MIIGRFMDTTIYHNPNCTKSRQALDILVSKGLSPKIIYYLKTPLTTLEIKDILKLLKQTTSVIFRTADAIKLGLNYNLENEDNLIELIVKHPILLERPIVIHNNKAVIRQTA